MLAPVILFAAVITAIAARHIRRRIKRRQHIQARLNGIAAQYQRP